MSQATLYQWMVEIAHWLPELGKWQIKGLALFSLGVIGAEHSALTKVAEKLGAVGKADSLERRFQRWLSNPRIDMEACWRGWIRWMVSAYEGQRLILLVDETKLGRHLSVMMVGIAYRQRCIPLVWRCYHQHEGQVALIKGLLQRIAAAVDLEQPPVVQADRGIGTSPTLCQAVQALGWQYLFRVQNDTQVRTCQRRTFVPLQRLVQQPGQRWSGYGVAFKKRGRFLAYVYVLWAKGQEEPWCLIANDPLILGAEYALRVWQEESFRDLKSGGWQWQRSRVWQPDHANRLILVLALAYAWALSCGTQVMADPALLRRVTRGTRRRFSVFRCALRFAAQLWERRDPLCPVFCFVPAKRVC